MLASAQYLSPYTGEISWYCNLHLHEHSLPEPFKPKWLLCLGSGLILGNPIVPTVQLVAHPTLTDLDCVMEKHSPLCGKPGRIQTWDRGTTV